MAKENKEELKNKLMGQSGPNSCGFDIEVDEQGILKPTPLEVDPPTTTTPAPFIRSFEVTTTPPPLEQQTFLGASIVSFQCNGGFGDSVSQLSVRLAIDPANNDVWNPNLVKVGEPVYFAFGKIQRYARHKNASTEQSFFSTIDDLYKVNKPIYNAYVDPDDYKHSHFAFGGLFQSWDYNQDANSGRSYNVTVVDPREILSNVKLLLNHHAGTTYSNNNLLNIFGFLEHINADHRSAFNNENNLKTSWTVGAKKFPDLSANPTHFENAYVQGRIVTGEGMSLRTELGIPAFRIIQSFNALMGMHDFPVTVGDTNYSQYGGYIKFRGHYYLVDLSDLPIPGPYYMVGYDSISLLELCQEFCDATNHELAVSLVPLCPRTGTVLASYYKNFVEQYVRDDGSVTRPNAKTNPDIKISGVIKISTINRNSSSGKVSASYIENLPFDLESKDIGQELATEVTDKFVTGGKETNMYYFDAAHDNYPYTRHGMHKLEKMYKKQVIPYYGLLGSKIVTIPRGVGPWTQILLDSSACKAAGVGNYYIATELELRAVDISFDKWVEFLQNYNVLFMEKVKAGEIIDGPNDDRDLNGQSIECTVPRCCWPPHPDDLAAWTLNPGMCSPPYGYPLYFGRATAIGLTAGGGATGLNPNNARKAGGGNGPQKNPIKKNRGTFSPGPNNANEKQPNSSRNQADAFETAAMGFFAKDGLENAKTLYAFLKNVTDQCLGKKFLVKIPQKPNTGYGLGNPFGFIKRLADGSVDTEYIYGGGKVWNLTKKNLMLATPLPKNTRDKGALEIGYNANAGSYEFSYNPEPEGGRDPAIPWGNNGVVKELNLSPPLLTNFFSSNGRTPPYVRYPPAYKEMDVDGLDPNSFLMHKPFPSGLFSYTTPPPGTPDGVPTPPTTLFAKAEMDAEYYFGPPTVRRAFPVYGQSVARVEKLDEDNVKMINPETGNSTEAKYIRPAIYHPSKTSSGSATLLTIDLIRAKKNEGFDYYTEGADVYVLITLPRVAYTEEGLYREGMANKVNLANLTHYLREDVVIGMPGMSTTPTLPDGFKVEDYDIQDSNGTAYEKSVEGLTFSINRRINMASPGPVFPMVVALPLTSNRRTYGPWMTSSTDNGRLEYISDESLTPWNYDGYNGMNEAGRLLSSGTVASDLSNERASFNMVGWPSGLTVAGLLNNGPAITSINVDFSTQGIKTTVTMDSYTPSFGKMQKQRSDQLKKVASMGRELTDQRNKLIRKNIINSKSNFNFAEGQKRLESYIDTVQRNRSYGRDHSTPLERGETKNNNISTYDFQPTKAIINNTSYNPEKPPEGDFVGSGLMIKNSAIQSSQDASEMSAIMAQSRFQYHKNYFNSIATSNDEMFHPASFTWHYVLPNIKQPIDRMIYLDDLDNDEDVSYYD